MSLTHLSGYHCKASCIVSPRPPVQKAFFLASKCKIFTTKEYLVYSLQHMLVIKMLSSYVLVQLDSRSYSLSISKSSISLMAMISNSVIKTKSTVTLITMGYFKLSSWLQMRALNPAGRDTWHILKRVVEIMSDDSN